MGTVGDFGAGRYYVGGGGVEGVSGEVVEEGGRGGIGERD